ncbi:hypothetical protein ACX1C1_15835 [Paenibacillus sp. strain BS8-2]
MFYGLLLFAHLAGLMVWVGSLIAVIVMLLMLRGQSGQAGANEMSARIIGMINRLAHPSSVIVLLSGVTMIIKLDLGSNKPLWLSVMEQAGGTVILLFLIVAGIMSSKLKKRLRAQPSGTVGMSRYLTTMAVSLTAILTIVLIVSLKL